jgi:hypothetical protein
VIEAARGTNEGMPLEKQRLTDTGQTEVAHEVHRNSALQARNWRLVKDAGAELNGGGCREPHLAFPSQQKSIHYDPRVRNDSRF